MHSQVKILCQGTQNKLIFVTAELHFQNWSRIEAATMSGVGMRSIIEYILLSFYSIGFIHAITT